MSEVGLRELHRGIVAAVESVPELGITGEKEITCLFPSDMMAYGLGTEIIIEVTGLYEKPERTQDVRDRLAQALIEAVRALQPDAELLECFVQSFNPSQGFASWRKGN